MAGVCIRLLLNLCSHRSPLKHLIFAITFIITMHILMRSKEMTPRVIRKIAAQMSFVNDEQDKLGEFRKISCRLPELSPWHESIIGFIENVTELRCKGKKFSSYDGENLTVYGSDLRKVFYSMITRKDNDDFKPHVGEQKEIVVEKRSIDKDKQKLDIRPGFQGCLQHISGKCVHPLGGLPEPGDGVRAVLHQDCGMERISFKMLKTGSIKHEISGKCLQPQQGETELPREKTPIVFDSSCGKASIFTVTSEGQLVHNMSGLCLKPNQTTPDDEAELILGEVCAEQLFFVYPKDPDQIQSVKVKSECIRVTADIHGKTQQEFHVKVLPKKSVLERHVHSGGIQLNILLVMIDSVSNAQFHRKLPKSFEYLDKSLGGIEMKGQSIVGDGTTAQMTALLTGIAEHLQTEARSRIAGAKPVDDWRFIFKDLKKRGYATMYHEEGAETGTFQYRLEGFLEPPTDHYSRPCILHLYHNYKTPHCIGSQTLAKITIDYTKSFLDAYPNHPKFALTIFSDFSHHNMNALGYFDVDLLQFLKLFKQKYSNDTILMVFGDHGLRTSEIRATLQGKLEERLPFMSVVFPDWFAKKYPDLHKNMHLNSKVLTSPFDFYATLQHMLSYPLYPANITTGQSLFKRIDPLLRSCKDTGIDSHWCPCLNWDRVDKYDAIVVRVVNDTITHMNNLLFSNEGIADICHPLSIKEVHRVEREMPNTEVIRFSYTKPSQRCDSCEFVTGEKTPDSLKQDTVYQVQFVTSPNDGVYEATIKYTKGVPLVGGISRLNLYKDHVGCIRESHVHLHKYCFCKDLLFTNKI